MNKHHPDDELLLMQAAGRLSAGATLVVSAHLENCPHCRARLATAESVGGVLLDQIDPVMLEDGAFSRTLARIDAQAGQPAAAAARGQGARPPLPPGMEWPRSLDGCDISPWHRIGPDMRWSRVGLPQHPEARVFLLRMGAGRPLAAHTHSGREVTQVLYGAFDDGRAEWQAGDFDEADENIHHRPQVTPAGECICLVALEGPLRFDGLLARALGAWMGI
ncbi:MAG: cupin domain-containing protein [Rhodocyclaceae bacterium]|nr:cupin domain-containing protein [Rhodocyclaceae bacterium]